MIDGRALADHLSAQIFRLVLVVFGVGLVFGGIAVCIAPAIWS